MHFHDGVTGIQHHGIGGQPRQRFARPAPTAAPRLTCELAWLHDETINTTLRQRLVKIGAKVVRHNRYTTFQMAAVAIDQTLFAEILARIKRLRNYSL